MVLQLNLPAMALAAILCLDIFFPKPCDSAVIPPGVSTSSPVRYHVKIKTKVVIPTTGPACKKLRVWHALPTTKPWSKTTSIPGVTALSYMPKTGKLEMEKDGLSAHVYFEDVQRFRPSQVCQYQSEFYVYSCDRDFSPGSRAVAWSRYRASDHVGAEKIPSVDPQIAALADSLKSSRNPVDFVVEASKWIRENITYDASVHYRPDDGASIMKYKRGHCGHHQTVFKQMCARVGIPYKPILGMFLNAPDGKDDLTNVRADYANNHTWSQVCFPEIGWVEVDPAEGANCFKIPATLIQNNTAFENYAVWVSEEGRPSRTPLWTPTADGKFVCDYGVENTITFDRR